MAKEAITSKIAYARQSGELYLSEESFHELPPEIGEIANLRVLKIDRCSLKTLPNWLINMDDLEVLDVADNEFDSFPSVILSLQSLRQLGLSNNHLPELPPAIGNLSHLTALVLPGNDFRELPSSIAALENLQILDLGNNSLNTLPEAVGSLQQLTHLYLWGNPLLDIPTALRTLTNLRVLDFSRDGVQDQGEKWQDRPPSNEEPSFALGQLVGSSNAREERFNEFPDWLPSALPNLRELYFSHQQISELPASFADLTHLEALFLSSNKLDSIPSALLELTELKQLDLHDNVIRELPAELGNLTELEFLNLVDNPLSIPPEVLKRPTEPAGIIEYTRRIRQATRRLNEAKLLIVGEGSVGKTSLVKRITLNSYDEYENKTEGIDVTHWDTSPEADNIKLNIWDFGGQEIMHATHQFFLTKRSVYILVIDARQGEEQNRIEYWLKLIQSFSDRSPVIIVGNKSDQTQLDIDQRGLRAKYENIVGIVSVSCRTGEGVDQVKKLLANTVVHLPNVRDLVPVSFFEIKQHLERLKVNYLSFSDYQQLCRENDVLTKGSQELLINLLHDLGTVLCFRDDPRLADTNILNPSWVTGGVYRLLNSNLAAQRKGLVSWPDINQILDSDDYPMERRSFIIEMMKKFELCYESDGDFLIPDLLTKEEPDTGIWDEVLHFEIKYDVLPSSIISRLIVRMKGLISKGTAWRTGLVLRLDRNRALVKGDREDSVISVDVSGPQNGRRGLLTAIRTQLREIDRTIPGMSSEERVPVPAHPGIWVPYGHLLELEAAGHTTVIPQGLTQEFGIKELLAGIETPADRISGRLVAPRSVREMSNGADDGSADTQPWTVRQSIALGSFLLGTVLVILAASAAAYKFLGAPAAAAAGALALAVMVIVGLFILRSAGRITEKGLLEGIKQALATPNKGGSAAPPD